MVVFIVIAGIFAGAIAVFAAGAAITGTFVRTPAFKASDGKPLEGSIAEFRRVKLGGNSQGVLIRGRNTGNPVVLFLHSGPGISETGMFRNLLPRLEDHFTMVYLDQRGGGKSYSPFNNPADFTTERLAEDVHELTQILKKDFGREKICVMGHSFGAPFGLISAAKHPDDYSLFIGIGQPVCPPECDRRSYDHVMRLAVAEGNAECIAQLESVKDYWLLKDSIPFVKDMMVLKKWVGYYGGQFYGQKGPTDFLLKNTMCDEFTVFDWLPYFMGMSYCLGASGDIMVQTDLRTLVPEVGVPVVFMEGRHDINTYPSLVEEYFGSITAPRKKFYWFENSAHFPHFEEPEAFMRIMVEELRPIMVGS